jgi:hypothetical protein
VFYALMVSMVIFGIEASCHILFFAYKGSFLFSSGAAEVFNIRDFSVLTNDERGFTASPNYANKNYIGCSYRSIRSISPW